MGSITVPALEESLSDLQYDALRLACSDVQHRYVQKHSISEKHHMEACKYMPGGNTRSVLHVLPFPLTIESAESCYLKTADGDEYVDFLGEYTAGIYGHNNPVIKKAVQQVLNNGWNYGGHTQMEQRLAKTVCERFPAMELVRFVNSGTEANTMALATALTYTQKKKILMFYGGYHGGTISGKVHRKRSINLPHEFVVGKYNDIKSTEEVINTIPKNSLGAVIVEPMMGSGGCFAARPEFLSYLRDLADQHGALLIFDEVMTSRLGYHGLGNSYNIKPDLMTMGKWVGGGMTFGAFGGRRDIMSMYDPRVGDVDHPGTFNNNVFTMTAGVAGCHLLNEDRINTLNALGDDMRNSLAGIFKEYGIEGHIPNAPLSDSAHADTCLTRPPKMFVTGVGSLMNIHFGGRGRAYLQGLYYHHMLDNGFYMAQRGFISLSIEITQTHVDKFVEATNDFCRQWEAALRW